MGDIKPGMKEIRGTINNLKKKMSEQDKSTGFYFFERSASKEIPVGKLPKQVKLLKGHFGPVYALAWAGKKEESRICTVSQDSKLIVWNAANQMKLAAVAEANWAMTVDYEPVSGDCVAYAGLDNSCYIYRIRDNIGPTEPTSVLRDLHQGYVSCAKFTNNGASMFTASGDSRCALWDVEKGIPTQIFDGHKQDCMSLSVNPLDERVFVSGSVDSTCKIWDTRQKGENSVITFDEHESDVNTVEYFPDGLAFISGSDDESCIFFDKRQSRALNKYKTEEVISACTSVSFSASGRVLFSGYDSENSPVVWDVLNNEGKNFITKLKAGAHKKKISSLAVSSKGHALATGSWDMDIKIWA